jgi:hypothetical protein
MHMTDDDAGRADSDPVKQHHLPHSFPVNIPDVVFKVVIPPAERCCSPNEA